MKPMTRLERTGYVAFALLASSNWLFKHLGHPDVGMTCLILGFVALVATAVLARRARKGS
jgi:hypothetical protein